MESGSFFRTLNFVANSHLNCVTPVPLILFSSSRLASCIPVGLYQRPRELIIDEKYILLISIGRCFSPLNSEVITTNDTRNDQLMRICLI